jgi:hypothetical protein
LLAPTHGLTHGHAPPWCAAGIPSPLWCGVLEGITLAVYFIDMGMLAHVFGSSHFKDKLWDSSFLLGALLCLLDWALVYPGGIYTMPRFSRPLRPLLLIAKLQVIRRLLATMLKTTPKMRDVVMVFASFLVVYAVLGVQLFSAQEVRKQQQPAAAAAWMFARHIFGSCMHASTCFLGGRVCWGTDALSVMSCVPCAGCQ